MKQPRIYFVICILIVAVWSALIYSSCQKTSSCPGICANGGSCTNGICRCPSGFSGNLCQLSTIVYSNNTYTTLTMRIYSHVIWNVWNYAVKDTIPPFSTFQYTGKPGDSIMVMATTFGPTGNTKTIYGDSVKWDSVKTAFSTHGITNINFDYHNNYFFLKLINRTYNPVNEIDVNLNYPTSPVDTQRFVSVNLPSDTITRNVGYFQCLPLTTIKINPLGTTYTPVFSLSENQQYILSIP